MPVLFQGPRSLFSGRGSQVVRPRSAKPLCAGSIPARASKFPPAGQGDVRVGGSLSVNVGRQHHPSTIPHTPLKLAHYSITREDGMPVRSGVTNEATFHPLPPGPDVLLPGFNERPADRSPYARRIRGPHASPFHKRSVPSVSPESPDRPYLPLCHGSKSLSGRERGQGGDGSTKTGVTLHRHKCAMKDAAFDLIRALPILENHPANFMAVLEEGCVSTMGGNYLRESDLVGLIQSGYVGTHRKDRNWLSKVLDAANRDNRGLVLRSQHRAGEIEKAQNAVDFRLGAKPRTGNQARPGYPHRERNHTNSHKQIPR